MDLDHLWQLEERFWTGDAAFYERQLAPGALMVFPPPVGVLERSDTLNAIRDGPRWQAVNMNGRQLAEVAPGVVVLVYAAEATRGAAEGTYQALCSSTYVRREGRWRLHVHQQTPAP